jgi:serine/threonine protein kinase
VIGKLTDGGQGKVLLLSMYGTRMVAKCGVKEIVAKEFERIRSVAHPHIVTAYGTAKVAGEDAIVLEELRGTLRAAIESGCVCIRQALDVGLCVGAAIAHMHSKDVVMRDLKPENIMIGVDVSKIIDLGVAHHLDGAAIVHGRVGTKGYLPPEVEKDPPRWSKAGDVWAWGRVMTETLGIKVSQHSFSPHLPPALSDLLGCCLSEVESCRPPMHDVVLRLERMVATWTFSYHAAVHLDNWLSIGNGALLCDINPAVVVDALTPMFEKKYLPQQRPLHCTVLQSLKSASAVKVEWGSAAYRAYVTALSARSKGLQLGRNWHDDGIVMQEVISAAFLEINRNQCELNLYDHHQESIVFHCCPRFAAESICRVGMIALSPCWSFLF